MTQQTLKTNASPYRAIRRAKIVSFVTELRRLAVPCKFAAVKLENLRARLVAGCHDEKIRERLFFEADNLTLKNAIKLAWTVERANSESTILETQRSSAIVDGSTFLRLSTNDGGVFKARRPPTLGIGSTSGGIGF